MINTLNDQLSATEIRRVVYTEEISSLNDTLANLSAKIEAVNTENHSLRNEIAHLTESRETEKKQQAAEWDETLSSLSRVCLCW